jgi:Asp-tRNA(Asn)/Glu-tRNA(Gln) amidotransferase A subunit family amidase
LPNLEIILSLLTNAYSKVSKLEVAGEGLETTSIAVPSRLKNLGSTLTVGEDSPLSGWRIAVKDIFQVEGIKTSVCNRAYHELYPPAPITAACVEILQRKGAHILGTTKLAAFAATEEPIECVDYQAPWNPRADGYQSPAGSSSGSGVAVASYDWVDVAVGSDSRVSFLLTSKCHKD